MDRESFELEKDMIEWLMKYSCSFIEAVGTVSYSQQMDKPLCVSYFDLFKSKCEKSEGELMN